MKTLALAVALALSFPLSSAAQALSDSAFAGSLAAEGLAPSAKLKSAKQKPAAPAPSPNASADEAQWRKLLEAVKKDGKYTPENLMPASFTLEETVGDEKGDHSNWTIVVIGSINDDEKFEAEAVMLVSVDLKLDPKTGNFAVEQWVLQTDVYGEAQGAAHVSGTASAEGKPLSGEPEKLAPGDKRVKPALDAIVKHWAERPVKP